MSVLATNKKARRDYDIIEEVEAGLQLTGGEVKSAKAAQVNLTEAFVKIRNGQAELLKCYISPYQKAVSPEQAPEPNRTRLLLLRKDQIQALESEMQGKNLTIVPLLMYTTRGLVKLKLGLARGKRKYEKKEDKKRADIEKETQKEISSYKT